MSHKIFQFNNGIRLSNYPRRLSIIRKIFTQFWFPVFFILFSFLLIYSILPKKTGNSKLNKYLDKALLKLIPPSQSKKVIKSAKTDSLEAIEWPLYSYKILNTHRYSWNESFFALNSNNEIIHITFPGAQPQMKRIYQYSDSPDIIKHFSLNSGDLFVTIFKEKKLILLIATNSKGELIYDNSFSVDVNVELANIRVNSKGEPICLLYYQEKRNYTIGIWKNGHLEDIYRIEAPIDHVFFQWKTQTVHMLHQKKNDYYWSLRSKKNYYQVKLPFHILAPTFFSLGRTTFLMGIDLSGNLWRFRILRDKLLSIKITHEPKLRYTRHIIPVVHQKKIQIFMSTPSLNKLWLIKFNSFIKNTKIGSLTSNNIFWGEKIQFLSYKKKLHFLIETNKGHLYAQKWNSKKLHLHNFQWKISLDSPPSLSISWEKLRKKTILYRYLLDKKNNSEPLGDPASFTSERIRITNVEDGDHVFHLQAIDRDTKEKSYLYHIPLFWLYEPPEPKVIFLNTISPSSFLPGTIKFYIKNQLPILYYVEISQKPKGYPKELLNTQSGIINLKANFKIGWYYLHMQARDPKSRKLSTISSTPFAIKPYDPNIERLDSKTDTARTNLEEIEKAVLKNRSNLEKLKSIKEQLENLEQTLKD